ncbi:protein kinase [Corynebacterium pseudotuberculosis]|uniref:non-specific serine/threonine protein kinase n=2 Tax=Corynebacterium pseudotuberculosis TaxID=1719 RepID=D9QD87_CORP2|nr:serine/threonine-protein kinase [Corynebacterium pseudotuberculosis]AER68160.1 Serine/threonine-protein kinase [Corynebacterium pseudotuberculosis 1/06-A]ADK27829.1 protein kinase [Corynebacterium pseudotuberculosis FRC41]ADL09531.1 protein kinase [Corynebacterium pseudotuberculosis C231]ADL19942.1 protein kinase [Corynebacterium pseudotuberculosis 1002]ADO25330.1 protein kinase [Corynebacterium pseudotuberculosis I19]
MSIDYASPDPALQALIGDDYRLQWVVGTGGMSTVWLADDTRNQREVAVKVLRPEFSDNNEFLSRFRNEALASENIISENVVQTFDYRELTDPSGRTLCFIVMEYVRGESLADMLARKGTLDEDLALDVLEQAAHGLSIIHRMGMVHRDIKPGNLLITQNGKVKITDFGIAKAAAAVPLTRTGMVVGTAQYVSPEQAQGKDVTEASDVYSLGVVGYEMLAGRRPFTGDSSVSVAIAHINQAPPALPTTVSAPARELIGIALRKDPAHRYADGNELALAVSTTRMGQRPPQPQSAQLQQIAPEPTPTASTHALGQTAQPTTVIPATGEVPQTVSVGQMTGTHTGYSAAPATIPPEEKKKSSGGVGTGLAVGVLLAALFGAGVWAASQGIFGDLLGGSDQPSSSVNPETITATVTETPTIREEPRPIQRPQVTPTISSEPSEFPDASESVVPLPPTDNPRTAPTVDLNERSQVPSTHQNTSPTPTRGNGSDPIADLLNTLNTPEQGGAP